MDIRIAGIVRESIVDGPGIRFVIFTQGCPHHCEGCHNPHTHDYNGGNIVTTERIMSEIEKNPLLKGVTFSGGEPFAQPKPLAELAAWIKARGLDIVTYTGYTFEQLVEMGHNDEAVRELLYSTDILIDGKFILEEKTLTLPFVGSRNQRVIDMKATAEKGEVILMSE